MQPINACDPVKISAIYPSFVLSKQESPTCLWKACFSPKQHSATREQFALRAHVRPPHALLKEEVFWGIREQS